MNSDYENHNYVTVCMMFTDLCIYIMYVHLCCSVWLLLLSMFFIIFFLYFQHVVADPLPFRLSFHIIGHGTSISMIINMIESDFFLTLVCFIHVVFVHFVCVCQCLYIMLIKKHCLSLIALIVLTYDDNKQDKK